MVTTRNDGPKKANPAHAARGNWVRAAILGADDGIVSTSSIMLGVIAAHASAPIVLATGVASLVAGAISMAAGEYVSVSSQRDAERHIHAGTRSPHLVHMPNPWQAAVASATSFALGSSVPLGATLYGKNVPLMIVASLVFLTALGYTGAAIGGGNRVRAALRVLVGGSLAMIVTFAIGSIVGVHL